MKINYGLIAIGLGLVAASCEPEATPNNQEPVIPNAYIICEGNFGTGNGDISILDTETKAVETEKFESVNGNPVGDVVQDIHFAQGNAYIVANGSNRIEVVNEETFASVATIDGLELPRYITSKNNRAYVSEWIGYNADWSIKDTGRISIIDLATKAIVGSYDVSAGPNRLLIQNNNLIVLNQDTNLVSVIDLNTEQRADYVLDFSPNSIQEDVNGNLWILCSGKSSWATGGPTNAKLFKAIGGDFSNLESYAFNSQGASNLLLSPDGNQLYFKNQGLVKTSTSNVDVNAAVWVEGSFYGIAVDPSNGMVYGLDAKDFSSSGDAIAINSNGDKDTIQSVGLIPNGIVFQ